MKISVILPSRNQSSKLLKNLKEAILPYFDKAGLTYEVIISASGSSKEDYDALKEGLKEFPLHIKLLPYDETRGKGYGVKTGFEAADGDYLLFMDIDLATDLAIFETIKENLNKYDAFFASRYCKGAYIKVKQPWYRRFVSKGSRILIKWFFHLKLKDTQCGYKCFSKKVASRLTAHQIINGFAFDLEYAYMLKLNKIPVLEIPAIWSNDSDSTVNTGSASASFFKDMLRIKRNKKNYHFKELNDAH